jgi:hypothetical protein
MRLLRHSFVSVKRPIVLFNCLTLILLIINSSAYAFEKQGEKSTIPQMNAGEITPPIRPKPVPQTQTVLERSDGTVEPEGPNVIRPEEIVQAKTPWSGSAREVNSAAKEVLTCLEELKPQSLELAKAVNELILMRLTNQVWVLVHNPTAALPVFAQTVARCLFGDSKEHLLVDISRPDNSGYKLFGTPPGYSGHLEGGILTNQLILRPASVIILSNIEFADENTVEYLRSFSKDKTFGGLTGRGGRSYDMSLSDTVLFLATSRSFSDGMTLQKSLEVARPKLDWGEILYMSRTITW